MHPVDPGTLLRPAPARQDWSASRMGRFLESIEAKTGRAFPDYEAAWAWSVEHLDEFWAEVWEHFEIIDHAGWETVLPERTMPGAQWFPGARINYTEHIVRSLRARSSDVMLKSRSQTNGSINWTGQRLMEEIGRVQAGLRRAGITSGDRVAGYLPNIPQTVAAYLAVTAMGAIWCSVPPEMGPKSVLDRITQLEPSLLIAIDGYRWGAKDLSRAGDLARIRDSLPEVPVVLLPYLDPDCTVPDGALSWTDFTGEHSEVVFEAVPFEHPLTVLFSSGTTGKPKAIVHSHGGLLLEHYKAMGLHFDMGDEDTAFFFSTTGWMVWTLSVSCLLVGAAMVLEDGDPNWPALDGPWSQWAVAAETQATYYATGSAYLAACAHAGLRPGETWDLSRVREIQCSGSPLAADVAGWIYEAVHPGLLLAPTSGGTDICAAFVGASPLTPVWAGEMSCRPLGVAVESWDPEGKPLVGTPGELVATRPMPSMPVFFWGDEHHERYRNSYFGAYQGVWRHGDWLIHTERGSWVITGRSDATLNRGGVRLGTAEFYAVLDGLTGIQDSMVLHFEDGGGMGQLVLLVDADDTGDTGALEKTIRTALRTELSPRHVPDHIVFVDSIPRNPNGKRLEIPLKRIIQGTVLGEVIDPGSVIRVEDIDETARRVHLALQAG